MEYYSRLDAREKTLLENYTSRLNSSSSKDLFTPLSTNRTNISQRLPNLNTFSSVLTKPLEQELIPKPEISSASRKPRVKSAKSKKSPRKVKMNGKFYTELGLNVKHPDLPGQIKLIFNIIEGHKLRCHQDLEQVNFATLKKYFCKDL